VKDLTSFLEHKLRAIEHPGDENGYTFVPGKPGSICGWLPREHQIYRCETCGLLISARSDGPPQLGDDVRIEIGGFGPDLYEYWKCNETEGMIYD